QRLYVPANAVLSIVGPMEHAELVEQVSEIFEAWEEPAVADEAGHTPAPPAATMHLVREKNIEQVHFCLGMESCSLDDPERYAAILLANVLGGGPSSRLFQEIREERGLAYAVYAFHDAYQEVGLLGIYA